VPVREPEAAEDFPLEHCLALREMSLPMTGLEP
jgi:hypothetical protein